MRTLPLEAWYTNAMANKQDILDFICSQRYCVVSSLAGDGRPQSALVGFGQTDDLQLVFATKAHTRKFGNLERDGRVSVVIGFEAPVTVQYEGTARLLQGEEAEKYFNVYYSKNPNARRFKETLHETIFLVEPKWIRYTDVTKGPEVVELEF
jgi:pyridoxine/pyridoxamine 5'-phosphate oxidase